MLWTAQGARGPSLPPRRRAPAQHQGMHEQPAQPSVRQAVLKQVVCMQCSAVLTHFNPLPSLPSPSNHPSAMILPFYLLMKSKQRRAAALMLDETRLPGVLSVWHSRGSAACRVGLSVRYLCRELDILVWTDNMFPFPYHFAIQL